MTFLLLHTLFPIVLGIQSFFCDSDDESINHNHNHNSYLKSMNDTKIAVNLLTCDNILLRKSTFCRRVY